MPHAGVQLHRVALVQLDLLHAVGFDREGGRSVEHEQVFDVAVVGHVVAGLAGLQRGPDGRAACLVADEHAQVALRPVGQQIRLRDARHLESVHVRPVLARLSGFEQPPPSARECRRHRNRDYGLGNHISTRPTEVADLASSAGAGR